MSTLVIIPTYNEEKTIGKLIDDLFLLNLKLDILIVDDGTDSLPDVVEKKQKNIKIYFCINDQKKLVVVQQLYMA